MKKVLSSDVLTPILAYKRLRGKNKIILESIPRDSEQSRFSIIAYNPVSEIKFEDGVLTQNDQVVEQDPLDYLSQVTIKAEKDDQLPFHGGAIGYTSYDMLAQYEDIGQIPEDTIGTPDMHFFLFESFVIFDHKLETMTVVEENYYSQRSEAEMALALDLTLLSLQTNSPSEFEDLDCQPLAFSSHIQKEEFEAMVEEVREHIRQGDMFQCVLSQRFSAEMTGNPFDYYRKLRVTNPSNYLYYFDFGTYQVLGASPESLVSVHDGLVTTNPIAGTRPRGKTAEEDQALAEDLLADIKEVAEHRMLVDLGRNDVGRVSQPGTVKVTTYMAVEKFRYVMHLTSVVTGQLRADQTSLDALKATLPAGTVSGAPKIRAMKRIYEAEKEKRGIYAGAIGYLSVTGDMDFAIAIRTMVVKNQRAYVQAGAGIVYDSVPEKEYQETVNKAKAMTRIGD